MIQHQVPVLSIQCVSIGNIRYPANMEIIHVIIFVNQFGRYSLSIRNLVIQTCHEHKLIEGITHILRLVSESPTRSKQRNVLLIHIFRGNKKVGLVFYNGSANCETGLVTGKILSTLFQRALGSQ